MNPDHADAPAAAEYATVFIAFELSKSKWKLGVIVAGSQKMSRYTVAGGDLTALTQLFAAVRAKVARAGRPVRLMSCYEAGFDGHWLHRWLTDQGVINHEIDPSSIAVNRRMRRAKTDRIDLDLLMRAFLAHLRGEPRALSVVRVPAAEDEDRKRRTRERERLIKERTGHINRIKGLLHGQGIRDAMPLKPGFLAVLDGLCTGDGRTLPPQLKDEIRREHERLSLVCQQKEGRSAEPSRASHARARFGGGQDRATRRPQRHWAGVRPGAGQ